MFEDSHLEEQYEDRYVHDSDLEIDPADQDEDEAPTVVLWGRHYLHGWLKIAVGDEADMEHEHAFRDAHTQPGIWLDLQIAPEGDEPIGTN